MVDLRQIPPRFEQLELFEVEGFEVEVPGEIDVEVGCVFVIDSAEEHHVAKDKAVSASFLEPDFSSPCLES